MQYIVNTNRSAFSQYQKRTNETRSNLDSYSKKQNTMNNNYSNYNNNGSSSNNTTTTTTTTTNSNDVHVVRGIEKVWAKELYELNVQDRELITNELHGVGVVSSASSLSSSSSIRINTTSSTSYNRITPLPLPLSLLPSRNGILNSNSKSNNSINSNNNFNDNSKNHNYYLTKFQYELDTKIPIEQKQSYMKGCAMMGRDGTENSNAASPSSSAYYIHSPAFRLGFIRTEQYNIYKAVVRYVRCLELLETYFGAVALTRPLLLEQDLTRNEIKFVKEGYVQILPSRDRCGRRILVFVGSYGVFGNVTNYEKFRVCAYLILSTLGTDISTQTFGMVAITSFTSDVNQWIQQGGLHTIANQMKQFFHAVPIRWSASHLCIPDDPMYHLIKSFALFVSGTMGRKMIRIHVGTPMECDYILRSFGIPTNDIPRTSTNTIKIKNHQRFIKIRKAKDDYILQQYQHNQHQHQFPHIECPEINCILFGRCAWDHAGNIEFRGIIEDVETQQSDNTNASINNNSNDDINERIYKVIQESKKRAFRFLMYNRQTYLYTECTDYNDIWKLVDQAVREYRKRNKAKRMINEIRAITSNNASAAADVTNVDVDGSGGGCVKCMKDYNGCRCNTYKYL